MSGINTKLILTNTLLDTISTSLAAIEAGQAELLSAFEAYSGDLTTLSAFLQLAVGTFSEAEPGTILATLRNIALCVCTLAGGAPPAGTAPNGCDDPFAALNERLVGSEDYPGRGFVEWDTVYPQGLEESTSFSPAVPAGVGLHLTATSTYYLWVQSSCDSYTIEPDSVAAYPTNQWNPVVGPTHIAISLTDDCAASAFICIAPDVGFVDCVNRIGSIVETVHATVDNSDRERLSAPLDGLGLPLIDEIVYGAGTITSDSGLTWVESNANGYLFTWVSGVRIRVWWKITGGDFGSQVLNSGATTYTITANTDAWGVDNWQDPEGALDEPFEVSICPPSEE